LRIIDDGQRGKGRTIGFAGIHHHPKVFSSGRTFGDAPGFGRDGFPIICFDGAMEET
jgi:hypothetical protein